MGIEKINTIITNIINEYGDDEPLDNVVDKIYLTMRMVDGEISIKNVDIDYSIYSREYICKYKFDNMNVKLRV